ncbi:MAG TPA: MupA/Atu3671 family FMN-dependent luciferase-like monooxygenase [Candidatus Polarisedimenticolia bacterium]|nr:MupA/Atu3671 family FMN-dependent luciferase-like monooxygenase [Candidatus Polarisedimenticolia bacterium]
MSDLGDRLAKLSEAQQRLLERRLREKGLETANTTRAGAGGIATRSPEDADPEAWRGRRPRRPLRFSLYFFSDDGSREEDAKYRLALESARFADRHGFEAVWTPERHFQPFGGLYPNPSVLSAALAAVTTKVGIRAGSVALPLHHPVRVAEEWSVVDNLSHGRAAVSFASGWHPDDFVLTPSPYEDRKEVMFRGIETIRRLWAGETLKVEGPQGRQVEVRTLPRPIQETLPIWVTTAGNPETWERAGSIGANVLAALVGYDFDDLAALIRRYRLAREREGHDPAQGTVTLVVHTYVGTDDAAVRELVREPMTNYLKTYLKQFQKVSLEEGAATERDSRDVARLAFEHFFEARTLLGTQNKCARVLDAVSAQGADEIACLIDFGLDPDTVLAALPRLAELREHYAPATADGARVHAKAP